WTRAAASTSSRSATPASKFRMNLPRTARGRALIRDPAASKNQTPSVSDHGRRFRCSVPIVTPAYATVSCDNCTIQLNKNAHAARASKEFPVSNSNVTLTTSDHSVSLPLVEGSQGPSCIDIAPLYKETGHFTFDPGFAATAACK